MPKNSSLGFIICVTGAAAAFGLVWHIWWMVGIAMLATAGAMIWHGFVRDYERIIPAEEVRQDYMRWLKLVHAAHPVSRDHETEHDNAGLADLHDILEAAE